jgi:hypothetical protein
MCVFIECWCGFVLFCFIYSSVVASIVILSLFIFVHSYFLMISHLLRTRLPSSNPDAKISRLDEPKVLRIPRRFLRNEIKVA